jgi:hypothetical protein
MVVVPYGTEWRVAVVVNIHERELQVPVDEVGPLLDRLGGPADVLRPSPTWRPMVLDGPVGVGAAGGHGPFRYRVTAHQPGRRVERRSEPARLGRHAGRPGCGCRGVLASLAGGAR